MNKRILQDCLRTAVDYLPKHPQFFYYPVYSFIIQNNKIVEWATNACGDPDGPLKAMYEARVAHLDGRPKIHAEVRAYARARGLLAKDTAFEVVNIRLNRFGHMRLSAPCSCCTHFLSMMNCDKVWFSTNVGWAKTAF